MAGSRGPSHRPDSGWGSLQPWVGTHVPPEDGSNKGDFLLQRLEDGMRVSAQQVLSTERKSTENAADHSDTSERMQSNHTEMPSLTYWQNPKA